MYLEISFERGVPVAVNGEAMGGVDLVGHLNTVGGEHGVGRVDHVENRLVGIKSREIYECPAAIVLHAAHKALETMTLSREQARTKARIAQEYSDVINNGLWFTRPPRTTLTPTFRSTQRHVTGDVRVRLHKGTCTVVAGRQRASAALYQYELATYDRARQVSTKPRLTGSSPSTVYPCAPRTRPSRTLRTSLPTGMRDFLYDLHPHLGHSLKGEGHLRVACWAQWRGRVFRALSQG